MRNERIRGKRGGVKERYINLGGWGGEGNERDLERV
jgi:hypothetical protein